MRSYPEPFAPEALGHNFKAAQCRMKEEQHQFLALVGKPPAYSEDKTAGRKIGAEKSPVFMFLPFPLRLASRSGSFSLFVESGESAWDRQRRAHEADRQPLNRWRCSRPSVLDGLRSEHRASRSLPGSDSSLPGGLLVLTMGYRIVAGQKCKDFRHCKLIELDLT
jgi:hypothetical protein